MAAGPFLLHEWICEWSWLRNLTRYVLALYSSPRIFVSSFCVFWYFHSVFAECLEKFIFFNDFLCPQLSIISSHRFWFWDFVCTVFSFCAHPVFLIPRYIAAITITATTNTNTHHQTIVYFDNNRAHVTMATAMKSVLIVWAQDSRLPQDDPENWWELPFSLENPALLVWVKKSKKYHCEQCGMQSLSKNAWKPLKDWLSWKDEDEILVVASIRASG